MIAKRVKKSEEYKRGQIMYTKDILSKADVFKL